MFVYFFQEYKRSGKHFEDIETITEDGYFSSFDASGKRVFVRLRNPKAKLRDKCVATDDESTLTSKENLFEGISRHIL